MIGAEFAFMLAFHLIIVAGCMAEKNPKNIILLNNARNYSGHPDCG
jgi:hypothetical protein